VEEGAYLSLEVENGKVLDAGIDEEATREHHERAGEKMENLRGRGRKSSEKGE
jgi:hypothetical protein